jgi:hypothetical protein
MWQHQQTYDNDITNCVLLQCVGVSWGRDANRICIRIRNQSELDHREVAVKVFGFIC